MARGFKRIQAQVVGQAKRLWREQDGITGLETAIVLIAFVIVSAVFAYGILNTGMFSADRSKESINSSMQQTRSNMEIKGAIVGVADTGLAKVEKVKFYIGAAPGAEALDFKATSLVVTYQDSEVAEVVPAASVVVTAVGPDNTDELLDPGETREVTITLPATVELEANEAFSLELRPRVGSVLNLSRSVPTQLKAIMNLN